MLVLAEEEGAEPHAGVSRRVEEERPRERSSGQEEGGESTPAYTNSHINICLSFTERSLLLTSPHLCVFAGGGV